jgi:non-specific serine/threonine protein kinase
LRSSRPPTGSGISTQFTAATANHAVAVEAIAGVRGLPVQLTSLVGREGEIATVRDLLSRTRLLTLTGAGGSGKTRLAAEVVTREAREGGRDVAWVELATIHDAALIEDTVLSALGVTERADAVTAVQQLVHAIGDRALLLVLDNCEHLLDACAALADPLLRECPALCLLATSRAVLGVSGETAWLVPPLSLPGPLDSAPEASESVQLFVERAHAVKTTFALTDENRADVVQICRQLDGLPLALELAAARLRALTAKQIVARLDDRFRLLTTGNRAALPRHQTLRAAIDWSYELLDPRERTLLARLSVFGGDFTLEAAEQVCSDGDLAQGDVLDLVAELVEKSLVQMSEADGMARYRLLETIRQYAAERLVARGETDAMQRRHAEFFFALAEEAEPHLITAARPLWVRRLRDELDNLRQALAWSREGDPEMHVRLVGALHWFWYSIGQWPEARQWLRSALTLPAGERPSHDRAKLLFSAGAIASLQARPESARVHLVEAEALAESLGDARLLAYARNYRAMSLAGAKSPDAEQPLRLAQPWLREAADLYGLRLNFLLYATLYMARGDLDQALDSAEEGVRVARVFGLDRELAIALQVLGGILDGRGDLTRATSVLREALECMKRDPQPLFVSRGLELLASCLVRRGMALEATQLQGAAAAIRERIGARVWQTDGDQYRPAMAMARAALGEAEFDAAFAAGRAMDVDFAVELALAAVARDEEPSVPDPTRDTAEYQVVARSDVAASVLPAFPALRVRTLGALEVSVDGAPVPPSAWGYARARELLVFLLCWPEGRTREQVGVALWPEASAAQVRNSFHVALHHLRRALGHADWVTFERGSYRLNVEGGIELDAPVVEQQLMDALRGARQGSPSVDALASACALYTGHFLEGEQVGDWHLAIRDRLSRLHASALEVLGSTLLERERYEEATEAFERLLQQEGLHEAAYRSLMLCRARAGDQAGMIREYRRLQAVLRRELDAAPQPETMELFRRLQQEFKG